MALFYLSLMRKKKVAVILKTGRFDNIDSPVIIGNVSKAVQLLFITAQNMLSKRAVLRIIVASVFLFKLLSSHIFCIPKFIK